MARPAGGDLEELAAPLRAEVRHLGAALGQVLAETGGSGLLADVERLRKAAIELRQTRGPEAARQLAAVRELVDRFELGRAEAVARAFTVYFQLVNLAEERHRVRILRQRSRRRPHVAESLADTLAGLAEQEGEERVDQLLAELEIHPVVTAHPTEARRRRVVDALRRVSRLLEVRDDPRLSSAELAAADRRLREQLHILWQTAQIRRQRPTPLDEVRSVLAVFDESLFAMAPVLYRELERAWPRPVRPFLRWGSWVGGDRDGNPEVTHDVTEATVEAHADHVLRGLEAEARRVGRTLTLSAATVPPSAGVRELIEAGRRELGEPARRIQERAPDEPHRVALLLAAERLRATRAGEPAAYPAAAALAGELRAIQESLRGAGAAPVAEGDLQELLWQVQTFGFHLASLEVRQHSAVHAAALSELRSEGGPGEAAVEALATLRTMARVQARFGAEACRRYVVSFTRSAEDVLNVFELARAAVPEGRLELDVVPLFESRADLQAAPSVLDELWAAPAWRDWLEARGRRLEIMLGYSDATKDAGYLAANLALYRAQGRLVAWARAHGVALTLFHGRGGAIGRGGGPAGRAIRSQAPGSVAGRFKVTEQGEVIFGRYGNPAIGLRHLEQVTSAVLVASTARQESALADAESRYSEAADLLAAASEAAYRRLVESEGFPEFFERVTPVRELSRLPIGSRPARRAGSAKALADLRAIPWVFAWTQNRCNLPGWFGLGSGLAAVADRLGDGYLREMVAGWPFLAVVVDNAEMSLAKADPMIAGLYLERGERPDLVDAIREEYRLTRRLVLGLTGHRRLLEGHPILQMAVDLRNPYVDALSFLQLRFLRELRALDEADAAAARLSDLVLLTVNGVAAGLQNTG